MDSRTPIPRLDLTATACRSQEAVAKAPVQHHHTPARTHPCDTDLRILNRKHLGSDPGQGILSH